MVKKKDNTFKEVGELIEDIINYFVKILRWLYDNIVITVALVLLMNTILFIPTKGGIFIAVINGIILIVFALRIWRDYRK